MRDAFGRVFEEGNDIAQARLVREVCDECGSRALTMGSLSELAPTLSAENMTHVREACVFLAVDLRRFDPVVWVCRSCGNLGVFGPWTHMG